MSPVTTAERPLHPAPGGALAVPQPSAAEMRAWLADRLADTERTVAPGTRVWTLPAPLGEPEALLEASVGGHGVFWHPEDGPAMAGVGVAHRLELRGGGRIADLERRAAALWSELESESFGGVETPSPRLFGGLAFAVGAADAEPWQEFGDGCFTLPRWTYRRDHETASLDLALGPDDATDPMSRARLLAELDRLLDRLARPAPPAPPAPRVLEVHKAPREGFVAEVEAIRRAIAEGGFSKIVAARSSRVVLADALDTSDVLRRLRRGLRASTRFAFARDQATFLGATPERLISRRGRSIRTEALAGSIASGGEHASQLLSSGKDRQEHHLVVEEIVRCLAPLCETLDVPGEPRIRELRDVLHLHTPVEGRLAAPRHVLELVERLHPTPAVGGVPTTAALAWILEHEPEARGWYAAPVGWFDARGDGDFAVALRSCVLRDREAFLYAGAGIVRDSDPRLEVKETELKKQALLTALGA